MNKYHWIILLLCTVVWANAQSRFLIKDVKVFDGHKVLTSVSVLVENGVIAELSDTIEVSDTTIVIDGRDKSLLPALSNTHVHAWSPQSLKEAARAGVLNLMDMHGVETYQSAMRKLKDSTDYANYYVSGYAATAPEGHGTQFGFPVATLSAPNEAAAFIQDRIKADVDYIKIIVEPWKPTLDSETVAQLIKEAHKVNKIAVVHVSRLEDAIDVISNDADGLVHIWWDKQLEISALDEIAKDKTFFVIPTLLTTLRVFENFGSGADKFLTKQQLFSEVKKLYEAGIPILAGTDPPNAGINYGTDLYKELELLHEAGLPIVEVLKTATSNAANAFSLDNTGYIAVGFSADLLLVEGDATQNLQQINHVVGVWKKGKRVVLE